MGGNMFEGNVRIPLQQFKGIRNNFIKHLSSELDTELIIPKFYTDKTSFGDMDVIIKKGVPDELLYKTLYKYTDLIEKIDMGYSIQYSSFQIDFINLSEHSTCMPEYYNYNDLPILIGILSRALGLKYSQFGLFYVLKTDDGRHILKEHITSDYKLILEFFGLSYDSYLKGFTKQGVFEYITTSKYFDKNLFSENTIRGMNKTHRKRFVKRPMFLEFLDYLENNPVDSKYKFVPDKINYVNEIQDFFKFKNPNWLTNMYSQYHKDIEEANIVKSKYNGVIVSELTGLKNKELGLFMKYFKTVLSQDELVKIDPNKLNELIKNSCVVYYSQLTLVKQDSQ